LSSRSEAGAPGAALSVVLLLLLLLPLLPLLLLEVAVVAAVVTLLLALVTLNCALRHALRRARATSMLVTRLPPEHVRRQSSNYVGE
jgi:hypothetical protein